jgi:hypothetical protein
MDMKIFRLLPLLLLLTGCTQSYFRRIGAARNLPAGTILQASDLQRLEASRCEHFVWETSCEPYTTDASDLIGRTLLLSASKNDLIMKDYTVGSDGVYSESWKRREAAVRRAAARHQ